jgi:alkylation response protein AidB-like acyl-CoA dehydrogenase
VVDFEDTPEEAAFRQEARQWLGAHAPKRGSDGDLTAFYNRNVAGEGDEDEHVLRARAWQRTLYDGGFAGLTWPKEFGGRGLPPGLALIWAQEEAQYGVGIGPFAVGIGMVGPTLISHGTPEQQDRWLTPMLRGEDVWCQLFSEPEAGSDLASLRTRAVRDGDEWVVNGQKVWTSGAKHSEWGALLARTDPDAAKHKGITYFALDMRTPGIEIRPLRQATGWSHFNEVFFTDVRIPAENVIGPVNAGWPVALSTLGSERLLISAANGGTTEGLIALARLTGTNTDAIIRQRVAGVYIDGAVRRYLGYRVQTAIGQGRDALAQTSVLKMAYSKGLAEIGDLGLAMQGPIAMLAGRDAIEDGRWQQQFLGQWQSRIGGGTEQVQRNAIGERVLGLPREPKPAKA